MTMAELAREAAVHFEAKKDSLRQTQDGTWKATFTVSPVDMPAPLLGAVPGTRYVLALVEIGDDEAPVVRPPAEKPKRQWDDLLPSQQAGIRCGEPRFAEFIDALGNDAADVLRDRLNIRSRAELDTNPRAAAAWRKLDQQYQTWLRYGSGPEPR